MNVPGTDFGIILPVYAIIRTIFVFPLKGWLKASPEQGDVSKNITERTNSMTLTGFSLAALTLFLTLGYMNPKLVIADTTLYLSISLLCFILAAYLFPLSTRQAYSYAADTFEVLGLLSVAIAMLIFFTVNFVVANVEYIYVLLLAAVVSIAFLGTYYTYKIGSNE